ncbi:MAG: zinc ribbon domain-containing protein, partial [Jiangellaceae bacterium]
MALFEPPDSPNEGLETAMTNCPNCGAPATGSPYCGHCGRPMPQAGRRPAANSADANSADANSADTT